MKKKRKTKSQNQKILVWKNTNEKFWIWKNKNENFGKNKHFLLWEIEYGYGLFDSPLIKTNA